MIDLTPEDKAALVTARDARLAAKDAVARAHADERALWERLLDEGKPKAQMARESEVTPMAITFALRVDRKESTKT